ncbi:MAG: hypothetical protein IPN50_10580 [Sphingomonadales bacterium]|jgi:hypothetical protein|uniref:hypothetical protein n=2 Tax=Sphingorhabdus sp. TaxID=1902408 RepID=UPI003BB1783E|nr:hypothetical protein [Sphingomonadales bacterium]MBK9432829.1 hypothetical protein [Sphingomonadales bacterium]MBL0022409.1 hypothetical protein [Sphingomonadales bacterium]
MAVNRIKRIWENAVPMREAWRTFASPEQQIELANLPLGLKEFEARMSDASSFLNMVEAGNAGLIAKRKRLEVIAQLREQLLDELFNSNLSAVGYRLAPSESRGPVQIDPLFFEYPEIDWDGSFAKFNGKAYRSIAIFDPRNLPSADKLKTGRPSSGDAIHAAIQNLIQQNPHFCNQHRAAACQQIRLAIGKPEIAGNGLSDKNLEKYILANCGRRQITK